MKNNDYVQTNGHSLILSFGSTGEVQGTTSIRLDECFNVARSEYSLQLTHPGNTQPLLIDKFSSENLAKAALDRITQVQMAYARRQRIARRLKGFVKWALLPVAGATFAMALNMAVSRAGQPLAGLGLPSQVLGQPLAGMPAAPQAPVAQPSVPARDLARAVRDGVKAEKFSITIGSGTKGPLYVFSDPSCPHCIDLEAELEKLSSTFTIHVFPVSVIGGNLTTDRLPKVMCAAPAERSALWKRLMATEEVPGANCQDGIAAVAANDQIFRAMRFDGTPTIINAEGVVKPANVSMTAESLSRWASGGK